MRDEFTTEEKNELRQLMKYYNAGKILISAIIGLGAVVVAMTQLFDFVHNPLGK